MVSGRTNIFTKGFTGLTDTFVRNLPTAGAFTILLDVTFTSLHKKDLENQKQDWQISPQNNLRVHE